MSAPERIWVNPNGYWSDFDDSEMRSDPSAEYIRADLLAAAQAEIARLTAERDRFERALARACLVGGTTYLVERAERSEADLDAAMAGRVKVKPLVWQYRGGNEYSARLLSTGLRYFYNHEGWWLDGGWMQFTPPSATDADKQSAAQADYEARTLAAIEIAPPAITPEALEQVRDALDALVNLNDEYSPFGGEIYQDRVERTWRNARAALALLPKEDM